MPTAETSSQRCANADPVSANQLYRHMYQLYNIQFLRFKHAEGTHEPKRSKMLGKKNNKWQRERI